MAIPSFTSQFYTRFPHLSATPVRDYPSPDSLIRRLTPHELEASWSEGKLGSARATPSISSARATPASFRDPRSPEDSLPNFYALSMQVLEKSGFPIPEVASISIDELLAAERADSEKLLADDELRYAELYGNSRLLPRRLHVVTDAPALPQLARSATFHVGSRAPETALALPAVHSLAAAAAPTL